MTETSKLVITYNVTDAAIAELRKKYEILPDPATPQGYKDIKSGIAEIRETRTGVEKTRKTLKADALEYGRRVDARAREIRESLESIEQPMKDLKASEDARRQRIKDAKIQEEAARVKAIEDKAEGIKDVYRDALGKSSAYVAEKLKELKEMQIHEEDFQEMTERAEVLRERVIEMMDDLFTKTVDQEEVAEAQKKREAELAKREAEVEKKRLEAEAIEKIEREKREAEIKKQQEELRQQQEELKKQQAEIQEQQRLQAEKIRVEQEKFKAEQQRIAQIERERSERELAKRKKQEEEAEREKLKKEALARYEESKAATISKLGEFTDTPQALFEEIAAGRIPGVRFDA